MSNKDDTIRREQIKAYIRNHPDMLFTEVITYITEKLDIGFEQILSNDASRDIINSIWNTGLFDVSATTLISNIAQELGVPAKDLLLHPRDSKMLNVLYKGRIHGPDVIIPEIDVVSRRQLLSPTGISPQQPGSSQGGQRVVSSRSFGKQEPNDDTNNGTKTKRIADLAKIVTRIARKMTSTTRQKFDDGISDTVKQVSGRLGQAKFRQELFNNYGCRCLITECTVPHVVEAAHIRPHKSDGDFTVDNGLLLRSDLHMLFDQHLLAFHPETKQIELHPKLLETEYACYQDHVLQVENAKIQPNKQALQERYEAFKQAQKTADYTYAEPLQQSV